MERNYDIAHALISCAVPCQDAISVLRTTSFQTNLIEKYLSKHSFNNLLIIENRNKGCFYSNGIMCEKFNRIFFNKKIHLSYISGKMWSVHFDIDNDIELLQKINMAIYDKKFSITNCNIKNVRLYNEIANVCSYIQEDLQHIASENVHIAKIWSQIVINASAILKLLKDSDLDFKQCSHSTLTKFIRNNLEMLECNSFFGIEKFEEDISYRKIFIPKLLYVLEKMA